MRKALAIFLLMAYNILAAFSILVAFINKMTKGRIPIMLKIYKEDFTVRSYQTDLNARMKPSAILEVMQEAAGQHSERLGLGRSALLAKNTAWVLTRVEVDMDRYPAFEETFSVETFPMPVRRCFFPRYFIFRDSNGIEIGRAATLWVLLDLGTRSMTKLDVVKALMPDNSDLLAPLGLPAAVTEVSGTLQTEMRQPRYTDLDFNGHVNNTRYLDWCCDALGIDTMRGAYLKHFAVNFDAEVMRCSRFGRSCAGWATISPTAASRATSGTLMSAGCSRGRIKLRFPDFANLFTISRLGKEGVGFHDRLLLF